MKVHTRSNAPRIEYESGEVVIADMRNYHQNKHAGVKNRPAVIVNANQTEILVLQLTKNKEYDTDGTPRVAIPNWRGLGLFGPAWLWSPNLAAVCRLGIKKHVGWVHLEAVDVLKKHADLTPEQIGRLREAADRHHP